MHGASKCNSYALEKKVYLYQIILCAILYNLLINQQILRYFYTKVDYFTIALIIDITEKPLRSCDAH